MEAYLVFHVGSLRFRGLQELAACRSIVKQIGHLNGGAGRYPGAPGFVLHPAVNPHFPAFQGMLLPGAKLEAGNAGDTGDGLSPETQMGDFKQFLQGGKLARGVTLGTEAGVFTAHAASVVRHPDQAHASAADFHPHGLGPGVQTVLHQLFDDGGRPFHDFARRHLAGESGRHDMDGRHG